MAVALIMGSTASAYALNVGVINATRTSPAGASATAAEPDVTTVVVEVPYDTGPTTSLAVEATTTAQVQAQSYAAPAPYVAPAPAPTPEPTPEPTPAPTSAPAPASTAAPVAAAQPTTTYETFAAGPAGEVVLAHTGNTLEFWAAYTANGWNYQVEKASGNEIVVKYRLGESEMAFIAKAKGGRVSTLIEGPSGGGGGGEDD